MSVRAEKRNQEKALINPSQERQKKEQANSASQNNFKLIMQKKAPTKIVLTGTTSKAPIKKPLPKPPKLNYLKMDTDEKPKLNRFDKDAYDFLPAVLGTHQALEKISEKNAIVIANSAIASGRADDINLLIKKLTLNFRAKYNEASFSIATGVFEGAQFSIVTEKKDLHLAMNNASSEAQHLLKANLSHLKSSLKAREINLRSFSLSS